MSRGWRCSAAVRHTWYVTLSSWIVKKYMWDPYKITGIDVILYADILFALWRRECGQPEIALLSRCVTVGLGTFGALRGGRLTCLFVCLFFCSYIGNICSISTLKQVRNLNKYINRLVHKKWFVIEIWFTEIRPGIPQCHQERRPFQRRARAVRALCRGLWVRPWRGYQEQYGPLDALVGFGVHSVSIWHRASRRQVRIVLGINTRYENIERARYGYRYRKYIRGNRMKRWD